MSEAANTPGDSCDVPSDLDMLGAYCELEQTNPEHAQSFKRMMQVLAGEGKDAIEFMRRVSREKDPSDVRVIVNLARGILPEDGVEFPNV